MTLDASVVIVLHDSAGTIEPCVASVDADAEVVLVDNRSSDRGLDRALAVRPDAVSVRSPVNRGFGGGCQVGSEASGGAVLVFLNPDAELLPGALARLVDATSEPTAGLVGPEIVGSSGARESTVRRWSRLRHDVCETLPSWARWGPARLRRDLPAQHPVYLHGGPVAYVQGACMAIRRTVLEEVGGFDRDLFLYAEEESLALRLASTGRCSWYVPDATVRHLGGASTAQVGHLAAHHLRRSRVVLLRKTARHRTGGVAVLLVSGALGLATRAVSVLAGRSSRARLGAERAAFGGLLAGMRAPLHAQPDYGRR